MELEIVGLLRDLELDFGFDTVFPRHIESLEARDYFFPIKLEI